ncbi:hypothetical protein GCM10010413_29920 [Promicromonospora sukumoe]|uniref:Uncharacterized protein n=1 Tax=Promicromonospora sukumoe TaxID=88382 RepID=A0A7W3J7T2_9MICO|nr:hypothetical protein [Promicromonospora sukumoe]MBA8807744.1 hypothetical protein [Promicromonospora sukumoe]
MRLIMTVRDWLRVDATMDNVHWSANQRGQREETSAAAAVRQAGWDQVATHGPENGGWPVYDRTTQVELSADQWRFVVKSLESWIPDNDGDTAEARHTLQVIVLINSALSNIAN